MNTFTKNVKVVEDRKGFTENGAVAYEASGSALVDLFFSVGASRGKDLSGKFNAAIMENQELAVRIMLWARDVRGGAGERQTFRSFLNYLETRDPDLAIRLLPKVVELGRFDDILFFKEEKVRKAAFDFYANALRSNDMGIFGLAAKWCPRIKSSKGDVGRALARHMEMTDRNFRKMLASLTKVVESDMCKKEWSNINYSHVPSVAASRYRKAFFKNDKERYEAYVESLKKGDKDVKVNASAIFPHDVLKSAGWGSLTATERQFIIQQWNALPTYALESVLPLIDVSGSMGTPIDKSGTTAMQVAIGLGLYASERQNGAFKDVIMTFSERPDLMKVSGDILAKVDRTHRGPWGMNTNIELAFQKILEHGRSHNVPVEDMPKTLLILSDMQFDQCIKEPSATAYENMRKEFVAAGYDVPRVIFWNLNDRGSNIPVKFNQNGTGLISGYSVSIMKSFLNGVDTPYKMMQNTVMNDRYSF